VLGGRIVAEYDSLSKKVTQLYTMREMVLPEDEIKIFDETLETRLEDTNQQLKKWMLRWKTVVDHSMKRVKELAKENSKPIWQHFTANKPAKTKVSRKTSQRKLAPTKENVGQPTNQRIRKNAEESVLEQSQNGETGKIQKDNTDNKTICETWEKEIY
jgi:hypothetical protein